MKSFVKLLLVPYMCRTLVCKADNLSLAARAEALTNSVWFYR